MALTTGTFTIHGASGVSSVINVTNDAFGLGLASSAAATFASLTAELATAPSSFYGYTSGSAFLALANNLGDTGVQGPNGTTTVLGGDGTNMTYFGPTTGTASAVIVGGNGNDFVSTGNGNDTVALGGGNNAVIIGNSGSVDSAGHDTVIGGVGSTTVTVSGTGTFVGSSEIPGASLNVNDAAGTSTTILTATATTVLGASGSVTTINADGPTTVNAGAGGTLVNQTGGTLLLNGLAGENDTINAAASTGPDTLYGASGSTITFTGSVPAIFVANDTTHGGSGSVVFNASASTGANQFWAGSGNATLIGGLGADTLVGGEGASTLTGGTGAANAFDLFSIQGGSATNVTITDFGANSGNTLTFFGYSTSAAIASQGQQPNTNNYKITLTDGSSITLQGVTSLPASQITFTNR